MPISLAHYCVKLQVESETEVIIRKERVEGFHLLSEPFRPLCQSLAGPSPSLSALYLNSLVKPLP